MNVVYWLQPLTGRVDQTLLVLTPSYSVMNLKIITIFTSLYRCKLWIFSLVPSPSWDVTHESFSGCITKGNGGVSRCKCDAGEYSSLIKLHISLFWYILTVRLTRSLSWMFLNVHLLSYINELIIKLLLLLSMFIHASKYIFCTDKEVCGIDLSKRAVTLAQLWLNIMVKDGQLSV